MKKNIINFALFALLLVTGMAGCKKELDINTNPNQPTDDQITAELILPNALHGVGVQTVQGYGWLNNWMGYWSASGSFNPSTEESSYNITNTFQEGKWEGIYNVLFDLHQVELKAVAANQPFYQAIAMICKAHLFQNLVDIYGNVPYTQAFRPREFPTPAYDKGEDIYANLQLRLDTAITLMKAQTSVGSNARKADIMFEGDTNLWVKLANTLKLRMLIRQTLINPNPAAEIAKIKANGGVLQSGETADVRPQGGYLNDVGKQNPYFGAYGLLPSGQEANTFFRANDYIVDFLKATEDPRLRWYFAPTATVLADRYVGTVYGSEPNTAFSGDRTSNIGPGLAKSFDQAQWVVTSIESMFLQAEAVYRGWDIGGPYVGNPEAAYNAAVTESFVWLGVENATTAAQTYLTNIAPYSSATTPAEQLELIILEKYLGLVGINPLEAWSDYRRIGVPTDVPLSINTARGNRQIPVRLLYPQSEYAVNAVSVQAEGSVNAQTSKLFWDKN